MGLRSILERSRVDVSALSVAQRDWLFSLSDDNLRRLANQGEYACENALNGKRCNTVRLPLFKDEKNLKIKSKEMRQEGTVAHRMRENKAEYCPSFAI